MYLIELNGQKVFLLEPETEYILGSSNEHATLLLEDESIASSHAKLSFSDGEWWVDDLESDDGTYLRGEELTPSHKCKVNDGDRVGFGLKEFVFSNRAPLFISENHQSENLSKPLSSVLSFADRSDVSDEQTANTFFSSENHWLSLVNRLTGLLQFSSDSVVFMESFLDILQELFGPERMVFTVEEEVCTRGCEKDDPLVECILHQARYQTKPLAFVAKEELEKEPAEAKVSAFYAPIFLDDLNRGYLYLLAGTEQEWSDSAFSLFSKLAIFASRGMTGFQVLHRAREDREVLHLNLVGIAPEMQRLKTDLLRVAQNDVPVFIHGEEGVGKSRIARAVHQASARKQAPLLVLNAARFPKELLEVELCGSVTETADGAIRTRIGKIDLAEGGSFLIEEIDSLPLGIQPTLLALLKSGQYTRVGGQDIRVADVRILFTSSIPIRELQHSEVLIPELVSLLIPNTLDVPSLRQRKEDIPQLFRAFLGRFGEEEGLPTCVVSESALLHLKNHRWTYNIRELRDIVARCFYEIDPEHPVVDEALMIRVLETHAVSRSTKHADILGSKVMALEHQLIQEALMAANDDLQETAKSLGISRVVLWRKMRALAIG